MDVVAHYAWFGAGLLLMTALTVGLGWWAGTGLRLFPLWAILRAVVQLSVIALLLRGILTVPWTVAGFVLLMLTTASLTAIGRIHELWHGRFAAVAGVLAGAVIALVVIFGLRLVDFQVRYLVAVGGIIIGNSMSAATLAGRNFLRTSRARKDEVEAWLSLGELEQFPQSQTRLATYRNPDVNSWDGQTGDLPCWVRNVDGKDFQVFAINCAHLGCPVRWFPQSNLFMCPCHGGVYYADGAHAAGPPPRGLFQYQHKVVDGKLLIKAGEMPTTGSPTADTRRERPPCA